MKATRGGSGGLVYSTENGRMCPTCRRPVADCACTTRAVAVGDGIVRVSRETRARAGKGVTLVRGLPLPDEALGALAKRLRTLCGAGGTVKDGVVEIQGDHRDKLLQWLEAEGYRVKRAGG